MDLWATQAVQQHCLEWSLYRTPTAFCSWGVFGTVLCGVFWWGERIGNVSLCTCLTLLQSNTKSRHRTNLGTEAEPQQIVAQRLLSCLQYPVP
jgi:hypothetical protein